MFAFKCIILLKDLSYDSCKTKISDITQRLESLKDSTEDTSEEEKQLTEELENQKKVLSDSEVAHSRATKEVDKYEKQVNLAKVQLDKMSDELDENNRYLNEAKSSSDKCATSIDKLGKEVKETAEAEKEMGKEGGDAVDALATALVASGVQQGIEKLKDVIVDCTDSAEEFQAGGNNLLSGSGASALRTAYQNLFGNREQS